jgi:hypothetical protein
MPSQTRSSSRLRSSAAKKIQARFKSRKIQRQRSSATRKIQSIFRGNKIRKSIKKTDSLSPRTKLITQTKKSFKDKLKLMRLMQRARKIQSRVRGRQTRKVINREKNTSTTVHDCPICFGPMTNDVRIALPCGHRFHEDCIRRSLTSTGGTCPKCRSVVTNIPYVQPGRANRTFGNVPLSQQQSQAPPAPPAILDPTQRRQYILQRSQEIEMLEQRLAQLPDPREMPNITRTQALDIQYNARQLVTEIRSIFYEASENYQNYRNVRINGNPIDQDVTDMYYRAQDLLHSAQVLRNNATQIVNELGDGEIPDLI